MRKYKIPKGIQETNYGFFYVFEPKIEGRITIVGHETKKTETTIFDKQDNASGIVIAKEDMNPALKGMTKNFK